MKKSTKNTLLQILHQLEGYLTEDIFDKEDKEFFIEQATLIMKKLAE